MTNRVIKFRIWNVEQKVMLAPEKQGELAINLMGDIFSMWRQTPVDKNKFILQQFTGLKDRLGCEIYEGDILWFGSLNYEVLWTEDRWGAWCPNHHKYHWPRFESFGQEARCSKIVGNIFENPELLK